MPQCAYCPLTILHHVLTVPWRLFTDVSKFSMRSSPSGGLERLGEPPIRSSLFILLSICSTSLSSPSIFYCNLAASNPSLALVRSLTLNSIPSSSPRRFSIAMILWVLFAISTDFPKLCNRSSDTNCHRPPL
ncbi:hypothetical protein TorRG33x02_188620 [Trema orientale]|uniref:Uncharacterized protein n=1 Tax=Trema orientale TaxID=63057 RepID=A0A2P5EIH4_TREOI|nr:hypothetical protein TorRG33x02_188620 [Trema orientale]